MRTTRRETAKLERTTFSVSRAAEYLDARELAAQTGQPVSNFATVALKELGDNALDASETAGVYPKLSVTVHQDSGRVVLTVADNGSGIEPEVVERILDFTTRTSDKALYRTPSRGLQENALKTIVGLPFALGDEDPLLSVAAHGVKHHIRATLNGAGIPEVAHEKYKSVNSQGTTVTVGVPARGARKFNPRHLMRAFTVFNPHADVIYEGPARTSNRARRSVLLENPSQVKPYVHQFMPNLSPETYESLKEDIRDHGILNPLFLDEDFAIVDGHNRVKIWTELREEGYDPAPVVAHVIEGLDAHSAHQMAVGMNVKRRNMTPPQKRELVAQELRYLAGYDAEKRAEAPQEEELFNVLTDVERDHFVVWKGPRSGAVA